MGPRPPEGPSLSRAGFDLLLLCAKEYHPAPNDFPGVGVVYVHLDDSGQPMTEKEQRQAKNAGRIVADAVRAGRVTLVTCNQGRNRSGLVVALALHHLTGLDGWKCIDQVRLLRNTALPEANEKLELGALVNPWFCDFLVSQTRERPDQGLRRTS